MAEPVYNRAALWIVTSANPALPGRMLVMAPSRPGGSGEALEQRMRVLLERVATERGITFHPAPPLVLDTLDELTRTVERARRQFPDVMDQRWLAAALAALSHHVQEASLGDQFVGPAADDGHEPERRQRAGTATVFQFPSRHADSPSDSR